MADYCGLDFDSVVVTDFDRTVVTDFDSADFLDRVLFFVEVFV